MSGWIVDTLLWTGVLIGLVLVIRRPVARWFGPQMAYALWALPMVRLLLPPIELPAWLAPEGALPSTDAGAALIVLENETRFQTPVATTSGPAESGAAASDPAALVTPIAGLDESALIAIAIAVWLIGAAAFLYMRFTAYFRLRAELFEGAREVGRQGSIRLIETPGIEAPLAFGVIDKVIALPQGFMAQSDRAARDLAIAHELAHHRAHDLAVNMAVQPLFAVHWFNPLGRYGWLALRRDQEAACDARVIAAEPQEARAKYAAKYASVIASFAAGPNVALAAPMACPVLGEKSIIHRLRSLTMTDMSNRRKIAGRALLGGAVLALPLTASISYAEVTASEAPAVPMAMAAQAEPPLPPTPPTPPEPDTAPLPPEAPQPPATTTIITVDPDTGETRKIKADKDVTVVVDVDEREDGLAKRQVHKVRVVNKTYGLSEEERDEILADVRESLADADAELRAFPGEFAVAMAELREAEGEMQRTVVKMECSSSSEDIATTMTDQNGVTTTMICQKRIMAQALTGLKEARKAISKSRELDKSMRKDILKELDRQIKEWEKSTS